MAAVIWSQRTMRWSQSPTYGRSELTLRLGLFDEDGALLGDEARGIRIHRLPLRRVVIVAVRGFPAVRSVVAHDPQEPALARDRPRRFDDEALLLPERADHFAPELSERVELTRF